ncbi:Phosphodiesterase [Sphingomonas antarctica]|uniref:alkaline phosphatase D family protein n=1 Tax=Sphingomonas antarctica TaxID=2040274 RepID=UPI0039E90460
MSGPVDRRAFIAGAAAIGATLAWSGPARASRQRWAERRDLYPEGVASGDPEPTSVVLWTRRPLPGGGDAALMVEVARDPEFRQVVATVRAPALAASDWTCRVLAAGLKPSTAYWYRFTDADGNGSRVGRTITAPREGNNGTVRFAFVSCQSVNEGYQNAFRRMIWEDERAADAQQLGFVLHLGDFIYEVVEYPDEVPQRYGRTVNNLGRVPNARKVGNFHVPTDVEGYRHIYRAYVADPDIQDARARFPFVCIGDNHEFSWQGWQSFIKYGGTVEPAQQLRVAANQAWWEYIPSRVAKMSGPGLDRFDPPAVTNVPIERFDSAGLGDEPNNLAALASMTAYRGFRYGANVELIITDHHSYTCDDPSGRPEAAPFNLADFPNLFPQEVMEVLDGGSAYAGGNAPSTIAFDGKVVPNFRREEAPVTLLGETQKAWWKERMAASTATWKIWAASNGTLDWRADPQNLPAGVTRAWPGGGYACFGGGDLGAMYRERAELDGFLRERRIEGFVTVSGDRHSFWAGYAAPTLPPAPFDPVGVAFITGSLSAPGLAEALEYGLKGHRLRGLFTAERPDGTHEPTVNLLLRHGVRTALEYAKTGNRAAALALRNPDNAPHLEFCDMGGHGYAVVTAGSEVIETEFVCVPRPVTRAATADGGPIRYRVAHRVERWRAGEKMKLDQQVSAGEPFPA